MFVAIYFKESQQLLPVSSPRGQGEFLSTPHRHPALTSSGGRHPRGSAPRGRRLSARRRLLRGRSPAAGAQQQPPTGPFHNSPPLPQPPPVPGEQSPARRGPTRAGARRPSPFPSGAAATPSPPPAPHLQAAHGGSLTPRRLRHARTERPRSALRVPRESMRGSPRRNGTGRPRPRLAPAGPAASAAPAGGGAKWRRPRSWRRCCCGPSAAPPPARC